MKFSIVVPSFNQAQYLEDCLDSIVMQRGIDKEIIVMDGGSTDGSADILKRYDSHLAYWQSQPDDGQTAALNEGFAKATGDIFCWLCSDDMYIPGALQKVAKAMEDPETEMVIGDCIHFREGSCDVWHQPVTDYELEDNLVWNQISQPSVFWTRATWEKVGQLDTGFDFAFDWEWFVRAIKSGCTIVRLPELLSLYRFHPMHKTSGSGNRGVEEILKVYDRHGSEHISAMIRESPQHLKSAYRAAQHFAAAAFVGGGGVCSAKDIPVREIWRQPVRVSGGQNGDMVYLIESLF